MEIALTSFGLSHLPRRDGVNPDLFYRMPPVSISQTNQLFMPDYAVLLLADRIVLDERCYEMLTSKSHAVYKEMAETARALHKEGFLRLESFDSIIERNKDLLAHMLEKDLKELDQWVPILKDACRSWREFISSMNGSLRREIYEGRLQGISEGERDRISAYHILAQHTSMYIHHAANQNFSAMAMVEMAMRSAKVRRKAEYRKCLRDTLTEYLSYVNANLILSRELNCGLHDWYDFQPFYRDKFLRVGIEDPPLDKQKREIKRLFEVPFPEFTFWDPAAIVKTLADKRINDLRKLVDQAVNGDLTFDRDFAVRIFREVMGIEVSIGKIRNVVSYLTMPLGFVPGVGTPLQKVVEEAAILPIARHKRKPYQWFYLISERSKETRNREED